MRIYKLLVVISLLVSSYCLAIIDCYAEETLIITTYYPSPYGSYHQLQTNQMAVGDTNKDGQLTSADQPQTDGVLLVAGSVGIGTMAPWQKLQLGGGSDANIYMDFVTDSRRWHMGVSQSGGDDKFVIQDYTAEATRFLIDTAGNVGIGTASPGTKLHILGQSPALRIDDVSDPNNPDGTRFMDWDIVATHSGNTGRLDIRRGGGGVNVMSILETTSGGNVGIGTTTPNSKLSIGENGAAGREYLKIDMESGDPPADECNEQPEGGRMIYDDAGHVIWACDGAGGWKRLGGGSQYVYINPALVFARGICNATIYAFAGASYTNNSLFPINQYVTVNYPAVIPTSATAIIVKFYAQADEDTTWISVRADHFPEDFIANAVAYNNDDDAASDTNTITMPYEANRQMQIRWYNTYNDIDNDIGVRAYVVGYIQ